MDRLAGVLHGARALGADAIRDAVVTDLRAFAEDARTDDETLVVIKATETAARTTSAAESLRGR
jgi:serine phosphatase RsbU (regulator of sigma subunit)